MNKNDILMIERDLDIKLTKSYKNIIENNPLSDKNQYPYVYDSLLDDAKELIELNLTLRKNGLQNKAWYKDSFIIGTNGVNCYYFIILKESEDGNVYYISDEHKYNPKNIKKHLSDKSFEEFVEEEKFMQTLLNKRKDEIDSKRINR